tara:strand:+ start:7018 stop:7632 length:615 start_codon:yes stop_codon:yes gene_type:complete
MSEQEDALVPVSGLCGTFLESYYKIPDDTDWEGWLNDGNLLQIVHKNINWWIGDWILYGEQYFPNTYSQAIFLTGKSDTTLRNCAWVSSVYPPDQRRDLSFTHHLEVAGMDNLEDRNHLLDKAEEEEWSAGRLRRMRSAAIGQTVPSLPDPEVTPYTVPYRLQHAVNEFCKELESIPEMGDIKDQSFTIPFNWGHIEMTVVKGN